MRLLERQARQSVLWFECRLPLSVSDGLRADMKKAARTGGGGDVQAAYQAKSRGRRYGWALQGEYCLQVTDCQC